MKILFISTVPVFPPSDGVRIPPAQYIKGLSALHQVDFLLLDQLPSISNWELDCETTRQAVHRMWRWPIRRRSRVIGLLKELFTLGPYYGYWRLDPTYKEAMSSTQYDAVIACTPAAIAIFANEVPRGAIGGKPIWIAAMSDLHSLSISRMARNASKNHRLYARTVRRLIQSCRSRTLATCEMKMLESYNHHFVQSEKEVEWIRQKGMPKLASRTVQLPNAVDDQLFSLPIERTGKRMAFVGVLSYLYAGRFEWFLNNVWKDIDAAENGLSLTGIGRGASESLRASMRKFDVEYVDFVENLEDIYREHDILVAPIYKGYGLINKVVEAMAAGCIVVGDATAFNGIPEFVSGKHGFVANTAEEFIDVLTCKISDDAALQAMREAARSLMEKHFRWSQRLEIIEKYILSHNAD